jgi:hypothetical protein
MTASDIVLAQLAAAAYRETSPQNRLTPPSAWTQIAAYPEEAQTSGGAFTGFSATAYRGPGGEIVIAYAGTKDWQDWAAGNLPAATGSFSAQVVQAAQFYWSVLSRPDVGLGNKDQSSFTGHSLGGGLASLMATYFDLPATTFDSVPFEASASGAVINSYAATFLALGIVDPSWSQYVIAAQSPLTLPPTFAQREARVTHVYVTNEILAGLRAVVPNIAAASLERPLDSGAAMGNGASTVQLHSMLLAWSMLSNSSFAEQIRRLPRLYGLMQDSTLFGRPAAAEDQDLLALMLNREGQTGTLTRFSNDLARISAGFADKSPTISDALIAVTMAFYYARRTGVAGDTGEASAAVVGGLQLALDQLTQGQADGGGYKAQALLEDVIDLLTGGAGEHRAVAGKERLTISDGSTLDYSDVDGRHDLIIGLTGNDVISGGGGWNTIVTSGGVDRIAGGAGDDILDAGADDDVLIGGTEDDRLQGGVGSDDYYFAAGDGSDVIIDADGLGRILLGTVDDAVQLAGGKKFPGIDNYWLSDPINGVRYGLTRVANGAGGFDLVITKGTSPDRITIRDWQQGRLGITLDDTPATLPPPAVTLTGDFNKAVDVNDPTQYVFDAQGNYAADGAQPDAADLIAGRGRTQRMRRRAHMRRRRSHAVSLRSGAHPAWEAR